MKCIFVVLILYYCTSHEVVDASNFTFTYTMAMRCKEHLCQHGYSYDTFYEVNSLDRASKTNEAAFEMHLAVLAASNGHVLLSTIPHPETSDPVYEIVIGGGANKFTELRRNLRRNSKTSAKTIGILSPVEFRAFYIRISEDGVIEFGKEGDPLPTITYTDVTPLTIKYFSFAAWNGVEAKFLYDCPAPGDNDTEATPDSKEVEKKLSPTEELKRTLLMDRGPNMPPGNPVTVSIDIRITNVRYNSYEATLTTGLAMVIVWSDNNLSWYPDKFNGTKNLKFRQGQIWTPTFFVFNADDMTILNARNSELINVNSSGEAMFHFQTQIETWCYNNDDSDTINRWPNDEVTCTVLIGAWEPHEKIFLTTAVDIEKSEILYMFSEIDDVIQNEWDTTANMSIVPISVWSQFFTQMDNETNQSDKLLLVMQMKRRGSAQNIAFYTPLLVLVTFVLLSFWNEPLQMSRVWFYAACTAITSSGLSYINFLVPGHTLPSILILYATVLMGVVIALLIQVMLMMPVVERLCKTVVIQSLMTAKWFRVLFCLPVMKKCKNYESINEAYTSQEDDDSGVIIVPRNGNVEEMEVEPTKYGEKEELAEAIDKLMFVVYSITFAVMLGLHY